MTTNPSLPAEPGGTEKKPRWKKWLAAGLTFVALVFLYQSCMADNEDEATEVEARLVCEQWVEDRLRAPATADFSGQVVTQMSEESWSIRGNVDSENGFGATLRATWTCDIRLEGDGWRGNVALNEG